MAGAPSKMDNSLCLSPPLGKDGHLWVRIAVAVIEADTRSLMRRVGFGLSRPLVFEQAVKRGLDLVVIGLAYPRRIDDLERMQLRGV